MEVTKVAKHAFEKLYDHAKGVLTQEGRDVEKFVADVKENWPFKTVSPEYFLDVTRPMMKLLYEIENEVRFDPNKAREDFKPSVEVLQDKVSYLSSQALECLHKLELETLWEEALMVYSDLSGLEEQTRPDEMRAIFQYAESAIFASNRQMIDMLKHTYVNIDPEKLYIDRDPTGDASTLLEDAKVAYAYAYDAFKMMSDIKEDILMFGMPAETMMGKVAEKLDPYLAATRSHNAKVVDYNIITRNDLDDIQRRAHAVKTANYKKLVNELIQHYSKQAPISTKQWSRENYANVLKEIDMMDRSFKQYQKEITGPDWSINFTLTKDGTYSASIGYIEGKSVTADIQKDNVDFKQTTYKNSTENVRTIVCGATTGRLKLDQESYTRMLRGETSVTSAHIQHAKRQHEKRVFTNERQFGTFTWTQKQTTKYAGKRSLSLDIRAALIKWSGDLKRTHSVGPQTKKRDIVSAQVEVAGASVKAATQSGTGTPTFTTEAHAVEAKGKLFGAVEATVNMGVKLNMGKQWSTESVVQKLAQVIGEELAHGGTNLAGITKNIEEMLNELPPSLKLDLGSFKITSGGFELNTDKTQINEQTGKKEIVQTMPTYDNLRDEIDNRHQHAAQLQAQAKELFQYNEKVFEVDPDSIEVQHAKLRYEHEFGQEQTCEREP